MARASPAQRGVKATAALPALALLLACGRASASAPDPWLGPDKALHFGVSVALAASGYAASSAWLDTRTERALAGGAFSLTLGASKELYDLFGHGDPSFRDLTWDAVGTVVGVTLAASLDALTSSKHEPRARAQGLLFHF